MPTRAASYPHPVIRRGADDIDSLFTATAPLVDISRTKTLISIEDVQCTNSTLLEMIESGRADYTLLVECGATFVRQLFVQRAPSFNIELPTGNLLGRVELILRIRASRREVAYRPSELNADYGETTFDLEAGAVLAEGPRFSFEVSDEFDLLEPTAGSLIRIKDTSVAEAPLRFDFTDANRIYILLSSNEFKTYLHVQGAMPGLIHSALVFPCLIRAIDELRRDERETGEVSAGWRRKLKTILERAEMAEAESETAAAVVLKRPFWRAATQVLARLQSED